MSGYDVEHIEPPKPYKIARGCISFAIETAMRAGEIASLTWNNINFEKRTAFCQLLKWTFKHGASFGKSNRDFTTSYFGKTESDP